MIITVLVAAALVGRMWAVPIFALTWAVPVALNAGGSPQVIADAFALALVNGCIGVGLRMGMDRLLKPETARA